MRTARSVGALGATLAVLVAAGCGSGDAQALAWSDKVCGAMVSFRDAVSVRPNIDAGDPAAAAKGLSEFTGNAVSAAQGTIADLNAAGAAPVSGGDAVVTTLKQRMTVIQTTFATAKSHIDAVDVTDATAAQASLRAAVAPLQNLTNLPDPAADLEVNPHLRDAVDAAPNCQKLRQRSGG
ncbi:hypothetical protein [Pseudonocardia acidicola]|uniref:Small secreted protein n=1 Tax=Pseudonocardia acidicola TaxID=2724939 RepID=A0ABX1SI47_9PSEU|nr:hypothetical protein [Pseudonocardia acidicola]NMI01257.1 hypothetical protein [Pseudonocardia acidicola]